MPEYVVCPDTTPPSDFSGTAFAHLDIRVLVSADRNDAALTYVGQTIYPANGTHQAHLHPNAEETVIVMSGHGRHRVGDEWYDIGPGDIVFVPRGFVHTAVASADGPMTILWVLGGAASLEQAGYEAAV